MHFRPCLPVRDWYWPCIRPCCDSDREVSGFANHKGPFSSDRWPVMVELKSEKTHLLDVTVMTRGTDHVHDE